MRSDGRTAEKARNIIITAPYQTTVPGSCLIQSGNTWVCCSVSVNENVPSWMKNDRKAWLTAEYGMLPGSSSQRVKRERNYYNSRSLEIGRLIGRALRAAIDLRALPQITLSVDCDVIQADGGTRTAAITGGYVSLVMAVDNLMKKGIIDKNPIIRRIGAISGGMVNSKILVDLNYEEDSTAEFDANFVLSEDLDIVEIQSTAEGYPIEEKKFFSLFSMIKNVMPEVFKAQETALNKINIEC